MIDSLKSGQNLKEHDAIKKAKKTREEVKKNVYDYAKEIKSIGSKVDEKLRKWSNSTSQLNQLNSRFLIGIEKD